MVKAGVGAINFVYENVKNCVGEGGCTWDSGSEFE